MKLLTRKKLCAAGLAVAAVPALVLMSGAAQADPTNPTGPRVLAGMGSDTTQELMNTLADNITIGGNKVIASYNAQSTTDAQTKADPACSYSQNLSPVVANAPGVRANGSGAGRSRLIEALTPGDARQGCLDFARSSSSSTAATPAGTGGLTYVPLALDAVTFAQRTDSSNSKTLTKASLAAIYTCAPATTSAYLPMLPQAASGTRQFFLAQIGVTEAQISAASCVQNGVTTAGARIEENDGTVLTNKKNIIPFSVGQFTAQAAGLQAPNVLAKAALGTIDGQPSQTINPNAATKRTVYNILPTARVGSGAPEDATLNQVFVGPDSLVCGSSALITKAGFAPAPNCGTSAVVAP
ncbi:MAG: hypothetical protein JWL64_1289 [Frankiales bacterium]|nr:hypothetical protein [Frankiales bacterium]